MKFDFFSFLLLKKKQRGLSGILEKNSKKKSSPDLSRGSVKKKFQNFLRILKGDGYLLARGTLLGGTVIYLEAVLCLRSRV